MIGSCFRKFPRYVSALPECKKFEYLRYNSALQSQHANSTFKRVLSTAATYFRPNTAVRNSYSTSSELLVEDTDLSLSPEEYTIDYSVYKRNLLYPESEDEVIVKLKCCDSCDIVLDTIKGIAQPKPEHLVQALVVLKDLCRYDWLDENKAHDFLMENSLFRRLAEQIIDCAAQLNVDELSCCILYLRKLGVDDDSIISLIGMYEEKIKKMDTDSITIESLCRVSSCVEEFENIWAMNTLMNFVPIVSTKLDSCRNISDFRKITGCFKKMYPLLSPSMMKTYVDRCSMLLPRQEDPIAEFDRLITVVRCLQFLSLKIWGGDYFNICTDLLLSLQGRTHLLPAEDQYIVYFMGYDLYEPYQLLRELKSTIQQKRSLDPTTDFRSAAFLYMPVGSKGVNETEYVSSMQTYVDSLELNNGSRFYRTMHFINLMHFDQKVKEELLEKFWNQMIGFLNRRFCSELYPMIIVACFNYVRFNAYTKFYNKQFESNAQLWLKKIKNDRGFYPSPVTKCILNLEVLYFNGGRSDDVESVCEYFVENVSRFKPWEAAIMTSILDSTVEHIVHMKKSSTTFFRYYVQMLSALNNAAVELLETNGNEKMDSLVHLLRNYCYGNRSKCTALYRLIVDRLNEKPWEELNTKRMLSMVTSLYKSRSCEPSIVDKMVQYCISRKNITGYPVIQVLNYLSSFGYTPAKCDEFVNKASQIIIREKEELGVFHLVTATLSLCYYNHLPRELSDHVFSVDFLNSVDRALSTTTRTRSRRLHAQFMLLNRAACLDFPNMDTPWFHDRYCQEKIITSEFCLKSQLRTEIEEAVKTLISNEKALEIGCRSPYYHKIDFILYTNKKGEPVDPNEYKNKPRDLRKIAILMNTDKMSSPYYLGKGKIDMLTRQLEKLEYKVAVIESYLWNSMFMSEPTAKETYLCDIIWSR